jgi:voltage-dependent calcium channel L type alpha-1D
MKIMAMGFVLHKNSYLRDYWNWIDFLVVVVGILEFILKNAFKLRYLRALRVLRPLRSISLFPSMRRLISGIIYSIPSLVNAYVFMFFVYIQFAIFSTE